MDVTPLVWIMAVLVAVAAVLAIFLEVAPPPGAAEEERAALITQPYRPGQPWEQPTPYYAAPVPESPDPLEVAANLDRKALLATALMFGTLAMTGAYFVFGPQIRALGATRQMEASLERGANLYSQLCFDCHGERGQGLVGFTLNKEAFRATCGPTGQAAEEGVECKPTADQKLQEFLFKTIARGRAKPAPAYSMPAWHRDEQGPLNSEQVQQLVNFIMHGDWEKVLEFREHHQLALEPSPPPPPKPPDPKEAARAALNRECIACHAIEPGAKSANENAPNLGRYGAEGPFSEELKKLKASGDPDWLRKWIGEPAKIKPETKPGLPQLMPAWRPILGDEVIAALAELLLEKK